MKINKALITAADPQQRTLPLQTLIDQDGTKKAALEIVLQEAAAADINEIGLIVCPGDQEAYSQAAGSYSDRLRFIEQPKPEGYAQAILLGREFVGNDTFLHFVGDHLCIAEGSLRCAKQLAQIAIENDASVSAVQATREKHLTSFGAIGGQLLRGSDRLYEVDAVLEKPTPTEAELKLSVPGLRAGFYLCFFGIHILKPSIFKILEETTQLDGKEANYLSTALNKLSKNEKLLAYEIEGHRYDIGSDYGLLFSQLALAFSGKDRDRVMSGLVEMLATR
ncbi:hypothetical protein MLD52_08205 [Puniceicoccaceae bacterium K14]|nr:hypothetical protein [Puniceicoccaceae bacterium K14]